MAEKKIKRLKNTAEIEYTEKKSLFIGFSTTVKNEEEALEIIKQKKRQFSDATHNVYAYIIGDTIARYSDDKEPQGTAGMPVLNAIRMSEISDVLVVVTRYFGGTLLGAGGLVRAYSTAASMALKEGGVTTFESYSVFDISCPYSDYSKLSIELNAIDAILDKTEFNTEVQIQFAIREDLAEGFLSKITEIFAGRITPKLISTRIDAK